MPLYRPAHAVFGWDPVQRAEAVLQVAERNLEVRREDLARAHAALGTANRCTAPAMRRQRQGAAMRGINLARRTLLDAHRQLDTAHDAPAPVAQRRDGPALGTPGYVRVLRNAAGSFPASSVATVDRSPNSGWYARVLRPAAGGGIATHLDSYTAALAWVDAQLTAPILH